MRRLRGYPGSPFAGFSLVGAADIAHAIGQHERVAYFHGVVRDDLPIMAALMPPKHAGTRAIVAPPNESSTPRVEMPRRVAKPPATAAMTSARVDRHLC